MEVSRPRRYFALHYIIFRVLGLGWWHHPDQNDTRNFHGWYLYYSITTELLCVVGFVILETIDPFIGEKDMDMFMFNLSFVITHNLTLIKVTDATHLNFEDATVNTEILVIKYKTEKQIEEALEDVLKSCFKQHQLLTSCVEKFSSTYSYGFMIQLLSSMGAICVVMVQISQDASTFKSTRLITSFAFFFAMIIQLALQCFTGNELTYQASQVAEAVMQCKWERMPPRLRALLIMTMIRAQRPLHLNAAGFANMDNECFVSTTCL
ncbi:unnamed protein product, partial [Iphiclides podalirius]